MKSGLKIGIVLLLLFFLPTNLFSAASAPIPWGPMREIEGAARREAKLVVYAAPGHIGSDAQQGISKIFHDQYGIGIDWTVMGAADLPPRVIAEQRSGQYVVDVAMGGIAGTYLSLKPRGYVVPILAPSTLEKGIWRLDPTTMAKERDWLYLNMPLRPTFFVNTSLVRPGEEPKNYQDLLQPKWNGKIVLQMPWRSGTGRGWFAAVYRKLGLDYMRALAKQVVLVPNTNDSVDAVVRGQYPIGIASSPERARMVIQEGAPAKYIQPQEGSHMAVQGIMLVARAPHLNAAKFFLQWLYTRDGQAIYAPKSLAISVRKDVPQDYLRADERYNEGQQFLMADPDDYTPERDAEITKWAEQIFSLGK